MPLRHPFRRFAAGRLTVGITLVAALGAVAAPTAAAAAPEPAASVHSQRFLAAPLSFALVSGRPDFGFLKTGAVAFQQFDILNDGDDEVVIDPAPLTALSAPYAASDISFTKTTIIPKNGHATFKVTVTAPAPGPVPVRTVTLVATDQATGLTAIRDISFSVTSTATDPAHFVIGGGAVDFGSLNVGASVTRTVTLTNDGVIPLRFRDGNISVVDGSGVAVPGVAVTRSTFGSAGMVSAPGTTATFDLTFTGAAAGRLSATLIVAAEQETNDSVIKLARASAPVSGVVDAVISTPTPTATPTSPTTPAATATPATPGATHTTAVTAGGRGTGGGLAETGLPIAGLIGLAGLLATGGAAAVVTKRRRAKA